MNEVASEGRTVILLVGPKGAGKSWLARALAECLGGEPLARSSPSAPAGSRRRLDGFQGDALTKEGSVAD